MRAMKTTILSMLALSAVALSSCSRDIDGNVISGDDKYVAGEVQPVEKLTAEIINVHPFDDSSFVQGLEMDENDLIVGTGLYGKSEIYRRDVATGDRAETVRVPKVYFGEGLTIHNDHIWQLTWKSGIAFKRDRQSLEITEPVTIGKEAWGVCSNQDTLYVSDGTDTISLHDPDDFTPTGSITVDLGGEPVTNINELECVDGFIYANVWQSTDIIKINPATGEVVSVVDASGLENTSEPDPDNVLNGIAYREDTDTFFLSGKRWNDLYEVRFVPET